MSLAKEAYANSQGPTVVVNGQPQQQQQSTAGKWLKRGLIGAAAVGAGAYGLHRYGKSLGATGSAGDVMRAGASGLKDKAKGLFSGGAATPTPTAETSPSAPSSPMVEPTIPKAPDATPAPAPGVAAGQRVRQGVADAVQGTKNFVKGKDSPVLGFLKGLRGKTSSLAREAQYKTAFTGPAGEIAGLGVPSALGYFLGKNEGRAIAEEGEARPRTTAGTIAGLALVPGATGYIIGKRHGYDAAKKAKENASAAKEAADCVPETINWGFWQDMPQGRGPVIDSYAKRVAGEDRVSVPLIERAVQYARDQEYPAGAIEEIRHQGNKTLAVEAIQAIAQVA